MISRPPRISGKAQKLGEAGYDANSLGSAGGGIRGRMAKKETRLRTVVFGLALVVIGVFSLVLASIERDIAPAVGATLLGFIIGMLVGFFVQEAKEWTRSAMGASVTVLTGAGAMALLRYGAPDLHDVWFYPAGLVIGFGFGTIWDAIDPP